MSTDTEVNLITIAGLRDVNSALICRDFLQSEGIEAFLPEEFSASLNLWTLEWHGMAQPIRLQIPSDQLEKAAPILKQLARQHTMVLCNDVLANQEVSEVLVEELPETEEPSVSNQGNAGTPWNGWLQGRRMYALIVAAELVMGLFVGLLIALFNAF